MIPQNTSGHEMNEQPPIIAVTPEKILEAASGWSVHGWHSSRLVKYGGTIYATVVTGEVEHRDGAIMRRDTPGTWTEVTKFSIEPYMMLVDPRGRFWILGYGPRSCQVHRSGEKGDLSRWEMVYEGRGASHGHSAAGMSPEGNVLVMHSGGQERWVACNTAFYDAQTDTWHEGKFTGIPEAEWWYGYEAIMLCGKTAMVVMNSYKARAPDGTEQVEKAAPWRYLRAARCEDLIQGQWRHKLIAGKPWGSTTHTGDVYQARDGRVYLPFSARGGQTQEESERDPLRSYLAVIEPDLSIEIKPLNDIPNPIRFHADSKGMLRLVGKRQGELRVLDVDVAGEFTLHNERRVPGTEMFTGHLYGLCPQRFGGEGADDFIYIYSTGPRSQPEVPVQPLWFLAVPVSQTRK